MEYASFDDDVDTSEMSINVLKKGWEYILRKQCIEKDPNEINISSDDSGLEDNDHIEAIEEENPQISFAAALQMLETSYMILLLPSPIQKCSVSWPLLLKSYKT